MPHNQERRAMTKHMTGTRKEWLAARLELLRAEKELTRRSDELARRRQELPWVRIDKEYRLETDEASASREAAGVQAADGVDVPLGVLVRQRLQFRLQRPVHRRATARGRHRVQL